ncbi:MAG: efflux RND transporter permease subunit [Eubacteriales bacterium]
MKLSEISVKRPVTVLMVVFIVLILGTISFVKIPIDLMPEMEIPVAVISTSYNGAGPQEMEKLVTQPLEEAVGTVEKLDTISSVSSENSSMVIAKFDFGVDMASATLDIREKVDQVKGTLPEDASDPMVFKFDPDAMPILMISISSENTNLSELQNIVEDTIKPRLERAEGVASVDIMGGTDDIIEIKTSSEKLQGYGISLDYISGILKAENLNMPGGTVHKGSQELTVKTTGEFESVEEVQQLLIPLPKGGTVPLNDIAQVELKADEQTSISKVDGKQSIDISIRKQSGTNTVKVSGEAQKELKNILADLPGTKASVIYDTADYVNKSISNVYQNGLFGGLLAILVLYLFLRNMRTTFIIATSIPISVIATFSLLYFSGITINMMTLGGLMLGIGMLVDNSVVVLENIYRFRQDGNSKIESAVKGSAEVSSALISSTLTTLAVFLPIVFTQGLTSTIFRQLALTISFSLLASLIVALSLVPMLSSKLLKVEKMQNVNGFQSIMRAEGGQQVEETKTKGFLRSNKIFNKAYNGFDIAFEGLKEKYRELLIWVLKHRKRVIIYVTIAFLLCIGSLALVGTEFFPSSDEGFVTIGVSLPDGAEVEKTEALMDELESKIESVPEIETVFIEAGSSGNMGYGSSAGNKGTVYVKLQNVTERSRGVVEISDEIRELVKDTPGAELTVGPMESFSMGGGSGSAISISIEGDDLDTLKGIGNDFVKIIQGIDGTREVESSYSDGIPEVEINIDRKAASQYGLTAAQIATAVKGTIAGTTATTYKYKGTEINVVLKGDEQFNENMLGLEQIPISTAKGFTVSLGEVAKISVSRGPVSINRENQVRVITVTSALSGRDVGSVSKDIDAALAGYKMPEGYFYKSGGAQQDMMDAFSDLLLVLALAIVLVYMVMASQFESLLYPFVIMFSIPLGVAGGILGLFITGKTLSVPAFIGVIMLVGIVVNNGIVLVDYINTRRRTLSENRDNAIINAGPIRLRPILMTTLTTVLAMIPMGLGIGEGTETSAPLAIVVIFGLTLSMLVTLIIIPVMYTLLDDFSNKIKNIFLGKGKKAKTIVPGKQINS